MKNIGRYTLSKSPKEYPWGIKGGAEPYTSPRSLFTVAMVTANMRMLQTNLPECLKAGVKAIRSRHNKDVPENCCVEWSIENGTQRTNIAF